MTTAIPTTSAPVSKWWICGLLFLATTLNYMDRMALNQTSPLIMEEFKLSKQDYGWLEGGFTFAFAIGAIVVGAIADRVNVWWIYPLIVIGWSGFGFATGFVTGYWMLFACRFGLGLFEAGNWPCGIRTTRLILKPEERSLGNALFQSGTAIGAIITPLIVLGCLAWADANGVQSAWRIPFRFIGLIGLMWVVLWFCVVPRDRLRVPEKTLDDTSDSEPFSRVFKDRRFWVLVLVIIAVNTPWHAFRVWMPLMLIEQHGYSEKFMMIFSSIYYLAADMGSISVGIVSLLLVRRGFTVHTSRMIVFGVCAGMTMLTFAVAFMPTGYALLGLMLLLAFGSLGLFPTYFALSQEISAKHQGKVTGLLGCINALYLTALFPLQGKIIDETKSYGLGLGFAGLMPVLAFIAMAIWWREPARREVS